MSMPENQSVEPTLEQAMLAVLDESQNESQEVSDTSSVDNSTDNDDPAQESLDAEELSDSSDESSVEDEGQDGDQPSDDTEDDIEIPQHWRKEDKEKFANLPREVKEFLVRREKETSAAFFEKTRELAETKRIAYDIDKALEPYKQNFKLRGVNPVQAVEQLLAYSQALQNDPTGTLQYLAKMYGVTSIEQSADEYADPALREVRGEIGSIKQMLADQESKAVALQQQKEAQLLVDQFKDARDASGNALRPQFDNVESEMAKLITGGMATDLEDAYQMACRLKGLNPKGQTVNKVATLQRKTVKEAKLAASGVKSSSVTTTEPVFNTLEEEMLHEMRKQIK